MLAGIKQVFSGPKWKEQDFKDMLCLPFTITKMIKSKGILVIESHIEKPEESAIFQKYPRILAEMDKVEKLINGLINFLKCTFADFGTMSQDMWNNLTAAKFEQVKAYIESTQVKVGTVLCGLTVKLTPGCSNSPIRVRADPAPRASSS